MQDNTNHHQPIQPIQAPPSLLMQVLGRIQQAEQVAEDSTLFSTAFTSPDWTWRVAAIEQLAHAEREMALPWLERALSDAHPSVRARAVHMLGQHQASELIRPALHDPDWQVREVAMLALKTQEEPTPTEFLVPSQSDPDPTISQPLREVSRQHPLHSTRSGRKPSMKPIDRQSPQPFSSQSRANVLQEERQDPTRMSTIQQRERSSTQRKRLPRLLTLVAALLVSVVLIGGMALVFTQMRSQTPKTKVGAPGSTTTPTTWNACDDNSNSADATLCAAHKETILNIPKTYGTQKVTFIRAYADTTQLMLVYIDGLASTDAVGFMSVTIQQGIVLKGGSGNSYSNPTTHQGYDVVSFATSSVPAGTTELHVHSIVDAFSGKSTPLNITVPFHTDQKTVPVNQTATSKGISLTLQRAVFNGSATLFYVGPEPYANGGFVNLFVKSISINGQPLIYNGGQSGNNVNGNTLVSISITADLDKPGSWTIQISGDQQGVSEGWVWTFHFTVPDTTQTK
jgi:hypothetical protein